MKLTILMKNLFASLVIVFLLTSQVQGQIVVEINSTFSGQHTTSSAAPSDAVPYNFNDRSVHLQLLYPASDLNSGGAGIGFNIDSIGWYVVDQIGGSLQNYTIKMKNTSATNTAVYDATGLTVVRSASPLAPATDTAWYMIPLTNSFYWDGTSNLLIDVCWGLNSSNSATGRVRHYSYGSSVERILLKSNSGNTCGSPTTQTAAYRPYLRLTGFCVDTAVTQNGNVLVASQPGATYQWINCTTNQPINGAVNSFYLPTQTGNYAVIVTNGVCVDTSGCFSITLTGLDNSTPSSTSSIFPNPSNGQVMIKADAGNYLISVYSLNGELLDSFTQQRNDKEYIALDLSSWRGKAVLVKWQNEYMQEANKGIIFVGN
jgi:hypothetical protein